MEKAGTSSAVDAWLFALPAPETKGGRDRSMYFKEPSPLMGPWKRQVISPEMVAEIGPCISRNHLQRWNLGKGRNQLQKCGRDRSMYFKETSPEMDPRKRRALALEIDT